MGVSFKRQAFCKFVILTGVHGGTIAPNGHPWRGGCPPLEWDASRKVRDSFSGSDADSGTGWLVVRLSSQRC